jgi:hypothetical protein
LRSPLDLSTIPPHRNAETKKSLQWRPYLGAGFTNFIEQGKDFKVMVTLHAATVERWIRRVQRKFLDDAPENLKCVDL